MKLDKIGIWSEIKLAILKDYAGAFTRLLKAKSWCKGLCYVDAFAGAGMHLSKSTGEMVPGSPLNALLVKPPFDRIILIDVDAQKAESLTKLCGRDKRVVILPGDCNEVLSEKVAPILPFSSYWRGLCVLDPYGIHGKTLQWKTVKQLANLKTSSSPQKSLNAARLASVVAPNRDLSVLRLMSIRGKFRKMSTVLRLASCLTVFH